MDYSLQTELHAHRAEVNKEPRVVSVSLRYTRPTLIVPSRSNIDTHLLGSKTLAVAIDSRTAPSMPEENMTDLGFMTDSLQTSQPRLQ